MHIKGASKGFPIFVRLLRKHKHCFATVKKKNFLFFCTCKNGEYPDAVARWSTGRPTPPRRCMTNTDAVTKR